MFSHPDKLNLIKNAKEKGFQVYLFHVSVNNPKISVERVKQRVTEGGHNVPEDKIRQRYDRNGPLIREDALQRGTGDSISLHKAISLIRFISPLFLRRDAGTFVSR